MGCPGLLGAGGSRQLWAGFWCSSSQGALWVPCGFSRAGLVTQLWAGGAQAAVVGVILVFCLQCLVQELQEPAAAVECSAALLEAPGSPRWCSWSSVPVLGYWFRWQETSSRDGQTLLALEPSPARRGLQDLGGRFPGSVWLSGAGWELPQVPVAARSELCCTTAAGWGSSRPSGTGRLEAGSWFGGTRELWSCPAAAAAAVQQKRLELLTLEPAAAAGDLSVHCGCAPRSAVPAVGISVTAVTHTRHCCRQ